MSSSDFGRYGRRTVLSFLLYGVAGCALANAPERSSRPIGKPSDAAKQAMPGADRFVDAANLGGKVSYVVADARTGQVLESRSPLLGQPPASVTKAMTALYALSTLGAGHRYRTRLVATGPISGGVLQGDLVLVGGGDPTLSTDDLFELAGRLKIAGIREIRGKLKVYGGALPSIEEIDGTQPVQVGYNPGMSGLNLNFNRVYLEWKRANGGYNVTMDARSEKIRPNVGFVRAQVADRGAPIFTYSNSATRENWTVARKALGKGGGRWLPVRRPAIYAGDVLQTVARSHGINLPFPEATNALPQGTTVAEHLSPDLRKICRDMLKFSTNVTAEVVGLSASKAGSLAASGRVMAGWAEDRYGARKASFVDHSGLGDRTKMSAQEMVKALTAPGAQQLLQPILKTIAVRDSENKVIQNSPIQIVAKTGTLNFVSGLAGYIRTPDGRDLAFAIFAADLPRRRALSKAEREAPRGARSWNGRAKKLQQQLIRRWSVVHEA
ncbi:D-alanyl-D-alanine carboxypeptidase/D-alanyl-D-alanine-endopeptidase [uncultured Litoreibacter sp.]|uniref:D-alanyl-D-alanine carboxypeptidase/D-alanyl-D-alanine endopeptidase n=1 Tax=uncultured Litoreibacter sp. TaxID=1392394 RepID=UPI00261B6E79|nr:D-alanyl-D-alanine carboxypeptidase/D-alanyl-D-alanine-endopeptidase [uncultured Litoreibacter sp.]